MIVLLSSCARQDFQHPQVPTRQNLSFAWSVPNHADDLILLREKLRVEHIECFPSVTDLGTSSFVVPAKDFNRARTAAIKIIQKSLLTVEIETDPNGWGYEIWKDGRKVGEEYF